MLKVCKYKSKRYVIKNGYYKREKSGLSLHRELYNDYYGTIPKGWHVHHINHDKLDNSPQNLIALPPRLHKRAHKPVELALEDTRKIPREKLKIWLKEWILAKPLRAAKFAESEDSKALRFEEMMLNCKESIFPGSTIDQRKALEKKKRDLNEANIEVPPIEFIEEHSTPKPQLTKAQRKALANTQRATRKKKKLSKPARKYIAKLMKKPRIWDQKLTILGYNKFTTGQ